MEKEFDVFYAIHTGLDSLQEIAEEEGFSFPEIKDSVYLLLADIFHMGYEKDTLSEARKEKLFEDLHKAVDSTKRDCERYKLLESAESMFYSRAQWAFHSAYYDREYSDA